MTPPPPRLLPTLYFGTAHVALVLAFAVVVSAGFALAYSAMPALIMAAVPLSETAAAKGLNSMRRPLGTAASSAVIGVIMGPLTVRLGPLSLPSQDGIRVCLVICAAAAAAG